VKLYAYDFQLLESYSPPLKCVYHKGVQTFLKDVEFIGEKPKELEVKEWKTFPIPEFEIKDKTQLQQARDDMRLLSGWFANLQAGKTGKTNGQEITKEGLLDSGVSVLKALIAYNGIVLHPKNWKETVADFYEEIISRVEKSGIAVPVEEQLPLGVSVSKITPDYLEELDDDELLAVHSMLHVAWEVLSRGFPPEEVDKSAPNEEAVLNAHLFVLEEFESRGIEHPAIGDELDRQSAELESGLPSPQKRFPPSQLVPIPVKDNGL